MFERTRLTSAAVLAVAALGAGAAHAQPRMALPQYYDPYAQPAYDPCACGPQGYYAQPQQTQQGWSYSQSYNWTGQPAPYGYVPPQPAPPPGYAPPAPPPQDGAFVYYNPGQSAWRPGLLLPPNMRGYKMDGWYRFLGKPARGYAWYKIGAEYILASTETGEIVKIVTYPN